MKKNIGWIITVIVLSIMLIASMIFSAMSGSTTPSEDTPTPPAPATSTPLPVITPDPCSAAELPQQIARVHTLTREFEDTAQVLTSTLLRDTSVPLVQDLQRIRRSAEDQTVPPCLQDLKNYQVLHMNARIDVFGTALAFMNMYGPNGDQNALNQLLEPYYEKAVIAARQYENEYATLLGIPTPTPMPDVTPALSE